MASTVTKADVLAAGKNIILVGAESDTCNEGSSGNNWGDWVHKLVVAEVDYTQLSGYPTCSGGGLSNQTVFASSYNDVEWGDNQTGYPYLNMSVGQMQNLVGCGVQLVSHEKFAVGDAHHETHIWSWNSSQPNGGSSDNCAVRGSKLWDVYCTDVNRYACKHLSNGTWQITDASGSWAGGAQKCYEEFGPDYEFSVPTNGYQDNQLVDAKTAANAHPVWVNYNDIDDDGDWEPLQQFTEAVFDFDGILNGTYHNTSSIRHRRSHGNGR